MNKIKENFKEGIHAMKKLPALLLFSLGLLGTILSIGCVTEDRYITTFTPEQKVPRHLDMTYDGPRANIAVGDFQVKARNATNYIGDGLREMLQTALFESQRFNVMDRLDSEGMTAEQMLSYSKMARKGSKKLGRQMEIAELLIYGTVTEFEAETTGAAVTAEIEDVPAKASADIKDAHMAIDIRVVDTASGRIVAARRIAGSALSGQAVAGTELFKNSKEMPISLGVYKNTPMELAIRDCIYRSVIYSCNAVPPNYFKH
jgi:curli biogenesis system outer membrane secretion channel CsgG